jgi:ribonuclease E
MTKQMLIDAAHAEETRVVVLDGNRIEEFDFETQNRRQLRGNIYLAKVTRVEPSLQAAFIEYGGNRHGFLAFNEIHPDYYQIPVADREALMREVDAEEDEGRPAPAEPALLDEDGEPIVSDTIDDDEDDEEEAVERRRRRLMRRYKIQEVIRRRQIMLVQVVKEERGNKGAALTTYLSLAGRYGVLMPNTARGGGISRKITTATDRKRLKGVVASLDVPQGMGLIVRTAGAKRTKAELKRDYDYLMRQWENIRDTTLKSVAPSLIYEEEDLVKRAIRDLYDKDIDDVWVEGEAGFREARDFMRMLMPSQAKKVQAYQEPVPLYVKHGVEDKLSQIYTPVVPLRSGGYLVINQTEALVAIDVNSGKSTRERNIEATAMKTNMEAAEEAARQLRLRDLAGLIVIDFIDMDESKNNRAVEKKMADCLKDDRARVQMGKISGFGLMEISRQRRRTGVLEGTTHVCEHCQGMGRVRSVESAALGALRGLELEALKGGGEARLKVPAAVGLYILNEKRAHLARLQDSLRLYVTVVLDDALAHADHEIERTSEQPRAMQIAATPATVRAYEPSPEDAFDDEVEDEVEEDGAAADDEGDEASEPRAREAQDDREDRDDGDSRRGGRRRRRRGGRNGDERPDRPERPTVEAQPAALSEEDEESQRRRRRGRRGGRRGREENRAPEAFGWTRPRVPYAEDPFVWHDMSVSDAPPASASAPSPAPANDELAPAPVAAAAPAASDEIWVELPAADDKPKRARSRRRKTGDVEPVAEGAVEPVAEAAAPIEPEAAPDAEPEPAKPRRRSRAKAAEPVAEALPAAEPVAAPEPETVAEDAPKPRRRSRAKAAAEPANEVAPVAEAIAEPEPAAPPPAPREPDPAEITAPPVAPRRGWWRRG